ncbi:hypothetical protein [Paenibacillus sp. HW567]|uniref:hypothetical protein n=1 Tax=Paenibacillus sp. HW567 TaxID=1034769 RepID=UPI000381CE98|nr:hypothetical protein [Paenibacillus sp. HW567]
MHSKKDQVSLFSLILAILFINLFSSYLNSLIWAHFSLFVNGILAQAIFLQFANILHLAKKRTLCIVFNLLALLAGLSTFFVILYSPMGMFNRIFFFILQASVTYAEFIQLRMSFRK